MINIETSVFINALEYKQSEMSKNNKRIVMIIK